MKALITGASSGMGRDMAKYLAKLGFDLVVVSRDRKKLEDTYKDEKVKVKIIDMDLTKTDNCIKLHEMLKKDNIDILINNAGFGDAGKFTDTNLDKELEMIDLNIKSYHILMKLFLTDFVKRDYGKILNVASIAGFMYGPYMSTYYATKNYVVSLTLGIIRELKKDKSKVKISLFCPGPVKTNFNNVANVKFNIGSIDSAYASKYAIDKMLKGKEIIVPPNMKMVRFFVHFIPYKLMIFINSYVQERKIK